MKVFRSYGSFAWLSNIGHASNSELAYGSHPLLQLSPIVSTAVTVISTASRQEGERRAGLALSFLRVNLWSPEHGLLLNSRCI